MTTHVSEPMLTRLSVVAAAWAFGYALYRGYYGIGGRFGMFGEPASDTQWRAINLVAAALLLGVAVLPLIAIPLWRFRWPRWILLAVAWLIAVACIGHALIDDILRVLSLAGRYDVIYPPEVWLSVDRRAADLQDLIFNETWFLIEGALWFAIVDGARSGVVSPLVGRERAWCHRDRDRDRARQRVRAHRPDSYRLIARGMDLFRA